MQRGPGPDDRGRSRRRARNIGGEAWSGYGAWSMNLRRGRGRPPSRNTAPGSTFAIVLSVAVRQPEGRQMPVDFGKTAADYAQHRAGFPEQFFDRLFRSGIAVKTDRVLDLGTGTGTVARGFARRGCAVTGLDPSRAMLDQAQRLDREAGASV